jgi:hypothetical protein
VLWSRLFFCVWLRLQVKILMRLWRFQLQRLPCHIVQQGLLIEWKNKNPAIRAWEHEDTSRVSSKTIFVSYFAKHETKQVSCFASSLWCFCKGGGSALPSLRLVYLISIKRYKSKIHFVKLLRGMIVMTNNI